MPFSLKMLKFIINLFFQYPEMMLSPSASSSTVTSPTPSQTSTTAITSQAPSPGQTVTRSPTPKSQTPVRNVFSVHPPPQQQPQQLQRPPQQQLQQRAKTQVEVAQAALILSRIEDMKGKTTLYFCEDLNNGPATN